MQMQPSPADKGVRVFARRRSRIAAAALALILAAPASAALAQGSGTATQPSAPVAEAPQDELTIRVGVPQSELERLRAEGERKAGGKATAPDAAHPEGTVSPEVTIPEPALPAPDGVQTDHRDEPVSASTERAAPLDMSEAVLLSQEAIAANTPAEARDVAPSAPEPGTVNPRSAAEESDAVQAAAPPALGEEPPADTAGACLDAINEDITWRVHNRFAACQRRVIQVEYWSIDARGIPVEHEGTTTATLEIFAQGNAKERNIRLFARMVEGSVDYDWGIYDNIFTAPNVPLSLLGECAQSSDVCHGTRSSATLLWVQWDNYGEWVWWDVYNQAESGEGRDQISYNQYYVEFFTEGGGYQTTQRGRTPSRIMRCDSAEYFRRGNNTWPEACIFYEAIPRLNYAYGEGYDSVVFHIYQAQYQPNTTYPLLVPRGVPVPRDKDIPGRYVPGDATVPGLHRITAQLHPGDYQNNRYHTRGACYLEGPFAARYVDLALPTRPGAGEECDEYPFASTLEGAAHPDWDFSVKAVPGTENGDAGTVLQNYYLDDRILAWDGDLDEPDIVNDEFWVNIE